MGLTRMVTENRPPRLYGIAKPLPYGGGFDEIQAEACELPSWSMPPPHGVGFVPRLGRTQSPT